MEILNIQPSQLYISNQKLQLIQETLNPEDPKLEEPIPIKNLNGKTIFVDGYNVIKQVSFLTGKKLRSGREGLVKFIERYRPQGSKRNSVTLVFDGQSDVSSPQLKSSINVMFSKGESADEKIKRMVERSKNPKQIVVGIEEELNEMPTEYLLSQNFPNPFNPITTIKYQIPHRSNVSLKIYDIIGNEVADLINEEQEVGFYNIDFNAARFSSGVYFYQLKAGEFIQTKKMLLLK